MGRLRGREPPSKLIAGWIIAVLALPTLTTTLRVRSARLDEARRLAAVRRESWWAAYRGVVPDAVLRDMDDVRTARRMVMAMAMRSRLQEILVITDGAGPAMGYAWIGPHREGYDGFRGEIYELYLDPRERGRGLGQRLLVEGIWRLVEHGMHPVLVWVLAANPARHFYEACGGRRLGAGPVTVGGRRLTRLAYGWRETLPLPR